MLLSALRRRRDEAQFTQALAAVASQDPRFAAELAGVLIRAAAKDSTEAALLLDVPPYLECTPEVELFDATSRSRGFVDLKFSDDDGFVLLVENKLDSDYRFDQIPDYLASLDALPEGRKGLLAVTRRRPAFGEPEPGTPGWLGSVRWARVARELHDLEPGDETLTMLWRVLLEHWRVVTSAWCTSTDNS